MPTFKARPTVYKGHQMRSRLEAGFASWLDAWDIKWEYEPCAFAHEAHGQYLPDFKLLELPTTWAGETDVYVEVKPESFWPPEDTESMEHLNYLDRAAKTLAANTDAPLIVASPGDVSLVQFDRGPGMYWPTEVDWAFFTDTRMGLAERVAPMFHPWHGEWWKGTF